MSDTDVFEDGVRVEIDLNSSGDWTPAVIVNYHKDSNLYDVMLLETNVTKTNIPKSNMRILEEDASSPRSPRATENIEKVESVDEYPVLHEEADDGKDNSGSKSPVKDRSSRSNSVEKVEPDDRKRQKRSSPSPERSDKPKESEKDKAKQQQFEYRPQRSKIPFDITKMSYEEYCAK